VKGRVPVYVEVTPKRTFAGAVEWPGWCRSGKTVDDALEALVAYADRYSKVVSRSRLGFKAPSGVEGLEVVERLKGNATTEFGAPGVPPKADSRPLPPAELKRLTTILEASWRAFDRAAVAARGVELTKGPRGGGRDLPKMANHVFDAEEGYVGALGSRPPRLSGESLSRRSAALHASAVAALAALAAGKPVADPRNTKHPWPPRFYVRRSAWHALDHAWEIEDRSS
jgi:nitroreductase